MSPSRPGRHQIRRVQRLVGRRAVVELHHLALRFADEGLAAGRKPYGFGRRRGLQRRRVPRDEGHVHAVHRDAVAAEHPDRLAESRVISKHRGRLLQHEATESLFPRVGEAQTRPGIWAGSTSLQTPSRSRRVGATSSSSPAAPGRSPNPWRKRWESNPRPRMRALDRFEVCAPHRGRDSSFFPTLVTVCRRKSLRQPSAPGLEPFPAWRATSQRRSPKRRVRPHRSKYSRTSMQNFRPIPALSR